MAPMSTKPLLVAPIAPEPPASDDELVRLAVEGASRADAIEMRIDGVPRPDLSRLRDAGRSLGKPVILTCRYPGQGGSFPGSEDERLSILAKAVELGFDYVDFEIAQLSYAPPRGTGLLILSHHDFEGLPRDPERLIDRALALGADVVKMAARVSSLAESLRLSELGDRVRKEGKLYAGVPLGPSGTSGRILARRLGSALAYAPVRGGSVTGPGQLPLDELVELYRFPSLGNATEIYGIVGARANGSLSPRMHNRFFDRLGRDAVYVPFEEEDLESFVGAARRLGVRGLSVTIPFKETILPYLDELDPAARSIGAVNTVFAEGGRWKGYNTDREGVLEPLEPFDLRGRRAIVVGAGGAARAAVHALMSREASVTVLARSEPAASGVARSLGCESGPLSRLADESWDLLVNATPVGSAGNPDAPFAVADPREGSVVLDMVTSPEETPLLRWAAQRGASTISGLEMLAAQGAHQALLWTGTKPEAADFLKDARSGGVERRYSRQILFKEIGALGQSRIRAASAVVVGAGALGSIVAEMLVRAGVGRLRIVDRDYVDETNLQRQSLYDESDWREGLPKAVAAVRKLRRINADVQLEGKVEDVHAGNVLSLLDGMDLILDGTDNFETRYLLNDASIRAGIPWIYAACVGSYGMSFVVIPGETPCLRCLLEDEPPPGASPTCDTAGVIAPAVHAVSAFQAAEALKLLSGRRDALTGSVLSLDVWQGRADSYRPSRRREDCPACGLGSLQYLSGSAGSQAAFLCGRNAVQVRPAKTQELSLPEVASRLRGQGELVLNDYLLRVKLQGLGREIVLFRDGRAIVHGTESPAEARSLYARYVGA
jgi:adenylyltransferase/sulfurtransferase